MQSKTLFFSKQKLAIIFLFLIYPFGSLPFIFLEIYNRKRYSYTLLSFFMGFCAILFPPFADLYRHTLDYFNFATEFNSIQVVTSNGFDFLLYTISNTFAQLGINFEFIRFFFVFTSYQISFWIFRDIVSKNEILTSSKKAFYISFFCVFLAVPFLWIVNGLRYALAIMFIIMSIYQFFFLKKNWGWFWLVLAAITHFGVLFILFVVIIFKIFPFIKLNRKLSFTLALIIAITGNYFLSYFAQFSSLNNQLGKVINLYIENSSELSDNRSFFGLLSNILERFPLFFLLLIIFKEKDKSAFTDLFFSFIILLGLSKSFMIIFDRLSLFLMPLFLFGVLYGLNDSRFKLLSMKFLLFSFIVSNLSYFWGYRETFFEGRTYKILYSPAPFILLNHYDQFWINQKLDAEGEFK